MEKKIQSLEIKLSDEVENLLVKIQVNYLIKLKNLEIVTLMLLKHIRILKILSNLEALLDVAGMVQKKQRQKLRMKQKQQFVVFHLMKTQKNLKCIYSGQPAQHEVIYAKAY